MVVYRILNLVNGKAYIGLTTKRPELRWKAHLSNAFAKGVNYYLYKAMRKYGKAAFRFEVLYEAVDTRELMAVEKGLIAQYGTLHSANGYNQSTGGESRAGIKLQPDVIAQMRTRTQEQIARNGHPMQGKKHTAASRIKMAISAKNKPVMSEATREKLSAAARGRIMPRDAVEQARQKRIGIKRTEEQCQRIAAGRVGKGLGNQAARKHPKELLEKALQFVRAGYTQKEAALLFGVHPSHISRLLSGDRQMGHRRIS